MSDSEDRQQSLWEEIPLYAIDEAPEDLPETDHTLFCATKAKRGLVATYRDDEEPETMIADMLADLRHLCDVLEVDFADCDRIAYGNYTEEKAEQMEDAKDG